MFTGCGWAVTGDDVITSPLYPSEYPNYKDCAWDITGPADKVSHLHFDNLRKSIKIMCEI